MLLFAVVLVAGFRAVETQSRNCPKLLDFMPA